MAWSISERSLVNIPGVRVIQKKNAHEVLLVVSLPAISWVRASAVSSASVMGLPLSSLASIKRARRSTLVLFVLLLRSASRRDLTAATAIPVRSLTAWMPLLKNGSGRYLAHGLSSGSEPSVLLTSPLRLITCTAGAYVGGVFGWVVDRTAALSAPALIIPNGFPKARSPMISKAR